MVRQSARGLNSPGRQCTRCALNRVQARAPVSCVHDAPEPLHSRESAFCAPRFQMIQQMTAATTRSRTLIFFGTYRAGNGRRGALDAKRKANAGCQKTAHAVFTSLEATRGSCIPTTRPWCNVRQEGPRTGTSVESGGNSQGNRGESEPEPAARAATGTQTAGGCLGAP